MRRGEQIAQYAERARWGGDHEVGEGAVLVAVADALGDALEEFLFFGLVQIAALAP